MRIERVVEIEHPGLDLAKATRRPGLARHGLRSARPAVPPDHSAAVSSARSAMGLAGVSSISADAAVDLGR